MKVRLPTNRRALVLVAGAVVLSLGLAGGLLWQRAQAASIVWSGAGTDGTCGGAAGDGNKWSCGLNWVGGTAPESADVAVFDGTSSKDAVITSAINVAGMEINTGYTGTITQGSGIAITVGASGWSQSDGSFVGGDVAITVNGTFTLAAGNFTSTSDTLGVNNISSTDMTIFSVAEGVSFDAHGGTVAFSGRSANYNELPNHIIDVPDGFSFHNVIATSPLAYSAAWNVVLVGSTTLNVTGDFSHLGSELGSAWNLEGNYYIGQYTQSGLFYGRLYHPDRGGKIIFTGSKDQYYSSTAGGSAVNVEVNKNGGSVSALEGTVDLMVDTLQIESGTFYAPSGTLAIGVRINANAIILHVAEGANFEVGEGTVSLMAWSGTYNTYPNHTIDVPDGFAFHNLTIDTNSPPNDPRLASIYTPVHPMIIQNTFTYNKGLLAGTWQVIGNYEANGPSAYNNNNTTATVVLSGAGDQYYSSSGTHGMNLEINKPSGSVLPAIGTTDLMLYSFSLEQGSFKAPSGTLTIDKVDSVTQSIFHIANDTIFDTNNGTVSFNDWSGIYNAYPNHTIDVPASFSFHDVVINSENPSSTDYRRLAIVTASPKVTVDGNFTFTYGRIAGDWEFRGNFSTIGTVGHDGGANLTFSGPNSQTYLDEGGAKTTGTVTINKTPGSTLKLLSDLTYSQGVTIASGTLDASSYNLTTGPITIGEQGVLQKHGSGSLTLSGNLTNNGLISLKGSTACGGSDGLLLRSSVAGTQRLWLGSGTFSLRDLDVQDQAGTAGITVFSGSSTSNNGANWTFDPTCPLEPVQLKSGTIQLKSGTVQVREGS